MNEAPALWGLIPAAGSGTRMRASVPKQFMRIGTLSVVEHSLDALWRLPTLQAVMVVSNDTQAVTRMQRNFPGRELLSCAGGAERSDSVLNGVLALGERAADRDWVLVHDAARPCVRPDDLHKLVETVAVRSPEAGGLLGVPVSDTIKQCDHGGRIEQTLDRSTLWHAQTPQLFRIGALRDALQAAIDNGQTVTDEASAMEHAGQQPLMVEGHADNIKITRAEDLALAELYLRQQARL